MSRISPFHFNVNEYDDEELENICPRYLKWLDKVKAFDFSKRKKGKIDRSAPPFELKYKLGENSKTAKRPKSFLSKIRKGGQNLRVRVRTSADLWRRWIRGGIMYNTELNEKDELEHEEQERKAQVIIKIEPQPPEEKAPPNDKEEESKESENNNEIEVINKMSENGKPEETKTDIIEINAKSDETEKSAEDQKQNTETETEKSETKETQSISKADMTSEEIPDSINKENVVKSNPNSNISITNSSSGMPEVVANND